MMSQAADITGVQADSGPLNAERAAAAEAAAQQLLAEEEREAAKAGAKKSKRQKQKVKKQLRQQQQQQEEEASTAIPEDTGCHTAAVQWIGSTTHNRRWFVSRGRWLLTSHS